MIDKTGNSPLHIFIHVHKTGGQTFKTILDRIYRSHYTYNIKGNQYTASMKKFLSKSQGNLNNYDMIQGHQFYGVHNYINRPFLYCAMLREPVARTLSLYNYLRSTNYYKEIASENLDIIAFLKSGLALSADNGMTRFLGGFTLDDVPYGSMTVEMTEKAISNVEANFAFVGLMEKFDISLLAYKKLLNWQDDPFYVKMNSTSKKYLIEKDISPDTLEYINKFILPDYKLYSYISDRFSGCVHDIMEGCDNDGLKGFQLSNSEYQISEAHKENKIVNKILSRSKSLVRLAQRNINNYSMK